VHDDPDIAAYAAMIDEQGVDRSVVSDTASSRRGDGARSIRPVDTGLSRHIGTYADALRVPADHDLVLLSGTPGVNPGDGRLPEDFADEARQAWRNVVAALDGAGATVGDIVQVRTWLTDPDDIATYVKVRKEFISHKPTYMLAVVDQVVWPEMRVELEVVAAVPPPPP
jgi:enamine deaminase RidA (YjgF/YER057c/UK114 family)